MSDDEQTIESSTENSVDGQGLVVDAGASDFIDMRDIDSAASVKEAERARIQAEIAAFLNKGGQITCVDTDAMSDPPKAPASNYGGQPI